MKLDLVLHLLTIFFSIGDSYHIKTPNKTGQKWEFHLTRDLEDFGHCVCTHYRLECVRVHAYIVNIYICQSAKMRNFLAPILTFVQLGAGIWICSVLSSTF